MQFDYLRPGDCVAVVQHVYAVSEPTSRRLSGRGAAVHAVFEPTSQELLGRGAACLCDVQTYLPGTFEQGWSLFTWCLNLSPWDCWAGVQPVYAVSKSTSS